MGFPRYDLNPQSCKKSCQEDDTSGPLAQTSMSVLAAPLFRIMLKPAMTSKIADSPITYLRASTTTQLPKRRDITSCLKLEIATRERVARTLRQRGQWCTTSLKSG
mmetsp:Transcript_9103/g.24336  ORF Transcript_9103/g.24336 Transcript_9103/m.24336 type:complete len:106 (+) Transcript_9103:534-851(+)